MASQVAQVRAPCLVLPVSNWETANIRWSVRRYLVFEVRTPKLAPLVSHGRAAIESADAPPDEDPADHGGYRPHQNADQISVVNDAPDYVPGRPDFQIILRCFAFGFSLKSRRCSL